MVDFQRNIVGTGTLWALLLASGAVLFGVSCGSHRAENETTGDSLAGRSVTEDLAQADGLYGQRPDLLKVRQGIALLTQARLESSVNYELAWKLAQLDYYLGAHTTDERERDEAFRQGEESGKEAVRLQDGKPEGHFWLGANYGGRAQHSMLASVSSVEEIRKEMEAVLRIDEKFQAGSAYMVLGQLYLQAPRILGGDHEKAVEYLERGLRFGSNNALLRLRLAEGYHAINRDQDAHKQIDLLLAITPDPNLIPEYQEAADGARALLAKMK